MTLLSIIAAVMPPEPSTLDLEWYITILVKVIAVFALIGLNAFFVAAEFAIVKVRNTQLEPLLKAGDKRAKTAQFIIHHINPFLNTTQVGITLASLGLGWIGEPVFAAILEPLMHLFGIANVALQHTIAFVVGFSVITFLHIILGECTPKTLSIFKPLESTLFIARPLRMFYIMFYPAIWLLNEASIWMLHQFGLGVMNETEHSHSEEELKILLSGGNRQSLAGRNIVLNALDLKHRIAKEVMTPRRDISFLSTENSIEECINIAESTRYSRFPLCENGNLDRVLGVVHIKDLYVMRDKAHKASELMSVLKGIVYVSEHAHLEKLLFRLMDSKKHFAMVVDEFGGTIGVITLENILEELVGQIQDEFDQEQCLIQNRKEDEWEVAGHLPIHQLESLMDRVCSVENVTTAAGLFIKLYSAFQKEENNLSPRKGDSVMFGSWKLTVKEADSNRIKSLILTRIKPLKNIEVKAEETEKT